MECSDDATDRRGVPASLWLTDHQYAIDQLQALVRPEDSELDEVLVLDARPAPDLWGHGRGGHRNREHNERDTDQSNVYGLIQRRCGSRRVMRSRALNTSTATATQARAASIR